MPVPFSVPSDDVVFKQSMVRACAVTLMGYDYLRTMPAEARFARRSRSSSSRFSRAFALYLAMRYVTLLDITLSTIVFFSGALANPDHCYPFTFVVRYLRCITASLAAAILGWRAWAICQRGKRLGWCIVTGFVVVAAIQIWSQSYSSVRIGPSGQCFAGNPHPLFALLFYVVNLFFDLILSVLATRQLWVNSIQSGTVQPFTATLIKEGLVYYVVCSAANVVNLVLWSQSPESGIQSMASNLGVVITSIMAQMLLVSLQEITVVRDTSTEEENRKRGGKLKGGRVKSRIGRMFGHGGAIGWNNSTACSGELSVQVHVDVLHTFEEKDKDQIDRERHVRPLVRSQSDGHERDEKSSRPGRCPTEADSVQSERDTNTVDLELGPVSPRSPGFPGEVHVRY